MLKVEYLALGLQKIPESACLEDIERFSYQGYLSGGLGMHEKVLTHSIPPNVPLNGSTYSPCLLIWRYRRDVFSMTSSQVLSVTSPSTWHRRNCGIICSTDCIMCALRSRYIACSSTEWLLKLNRTSLTRDTGRLAICLWIRGKPCLRRVIRPQMVLSINSSPVTRSVSQRRSLLRL